ncbi:hypothetical protein AB0912_28620 [Streptomyces sp. NPDC007084]|uniref:hypothetical protein n=1 Tax=Streptomyces sp. NPDC007084 TaxID=3154313 RepID=UPI00345319FF
MDATTEYRRHILEEYRLRIEGDLKLLENEKTEIENSELDKSEIASRVAAIHHVCKVLTDIRRHLEDARRARHSWNAALVS